MPTVPLTQLPKSRSAEEFESICADVLNMMYNTTFVPYGRHGQKQNGIDLFDSSVQTSHIVAQCKNYYACTYEKLREQIEKDIYSAGNLPFPIHTFIAMTSLDRDVTTQNIILSINTTFEIKILFWDDIQSKLCSDIILLQKYYPYFFTDSIIPLEYRNEIISCAYILKQQADNLSCNYSNYRVAYHYNDDAMMYNFCVGMMNAAIRLFQLHDQWYLQLKNARIASPIEKIVKNMPSFYDESTDGTGGAMIYTIMDFRSYFLDIDKKEKFICRCNKIIKRTEEL